MLHWEGLHRLGFGGGLFFDEGHWYVCNDQKRRCPQFQLVCCGMRSDIKYWLVVLGYWFLYLSPLLVRFYLGWICLGRFVEWLSFGDLPSCHRSFGCCSHVERGSHGSSSILWGPGWLPIQLELSVDVRLFFHRGFWLLDCPVFVLGGRWCQGLFVVGQ